MKPFAYGFAAFDAETCPQPGDAKIFQLLLDSRKIAWRKFHDSGGCLIHEARKSKRAVIDLLRREAVKQDRQCQVAALFRRPGRFLGNCRHPPGEVRRRNPCARTGRGDRPVLLG